MSLALFLPSSIIPALSAVRIDAVEKKLLRIEQMEAPVVHRFGAGIYIREVRLTAGMLAIGHHHKHAHMNVMLAGRATFLNPDGTTTEYVAPISAVWPAGRKIAIVHEDMIWQNIYSTDETDVAALEEQLLDKSESWLADQSERLRIESFKHSADRDDFLDAIGELGFTPEQVRSVSENEDDQIPMPAGNCKTIIAESPIEGRGVFATCRIAPGEVVGVARLDGMRTPIGRFTNHSEYPNCEMEYIRDNCIALVAMEPLNGCTGGNPGDECTVDYRHSFQEGNRNLPKEEQCLQLQ